MKLIAFLVCSLFLVLSLAAQDVIHLENGKSVNGRVLEVGPETISYKKLTNPQGPTYKVEKNEVKMVEYENGTRDVFDQEEEKVETDIDYFVKGQRDADRFYDGYKTAGTGTLFVSLLSPLVGLIPALATSVTTPDQSNLGYPDSDLYKVDSYRRGYRHRAKKIKSRKVWTNWGIALGVNFVLVLYIMSTAN